MLAALKFCFASLVLVLNTLFHGLLDRGVYIAPALYAAGFVRAAHTQQDITETIAVAHEAFKLLSK